MKTKWMIPGIVVLGIAAAAPWGVGYYTERQWQGVENGFNDAQGILRLETRTYDRGYMNASIRGSVTLIAPESGEQHSFDYQARVTHGVTGSLMDFSTTEDMGAGAKKLFPQEKPRLTLETHLWGTATLEMTVPEVDVQDEATGETLNIARVYGRADISSAGSGLDIQVDWPGMTITGPELQLSVTDFALNQTFEHLTGDLWLGGGELTLANMQFNAPEQPSLGFDGLSIVSDTDASSDDRRLNGESSIRLDQLATNDREYGPHEIQIRFDGLDVASLDEISSAVKDMQQAAIMSAGDTDSRAVMQQQMESFQRVNKAVSGLAAEGFSFGFPKIDLSTPEGPIRGELIVSHPELSDQERSQAMMVMQGLTGNFDISLPAVLVEENQALAMQVAPLIKQGMVVQNGERLRMVGTLEDMALTINGNVLPLPPIF